ncbi:unnamed protein product [Fusarium graminearum]|nr:unnamed protein product [Fusarium graminearum]VTO87721.1 unnamed protein product [Fusarium graminearum]
MTTPTIMPPTSPFRSFPSLSTPSTTTSRNATIKTPIAPCPLVEAIEERLCVYYNEEDCGEEELGDAQEQSHHRRSPNTAVSIGRDIENTIRSQEQARAKAQMYHDQKVSKLDEYRRNTVNGMLCQELSRRSRLISDIGLSTQSRLAPDRKPPHTLPSWSMYSTNKSMLSSHIFACQSASILYTLCYVVTRSDGFMKACARGQDSTTKLLPFTFWDGVSYAEANLAKAGTETVFIQHPRSSREPADRQNQKEAAKIAKTSTKHVLRGMTINEQ